MSEPLPGQAAPATALRGKKPAKVLREIQGARPGALRGRRGESSGQRQNTRRHASPDHGAGNPGSARSAARRTSRWTARSATAGMRANCSPRSSRAGGCSDSMSIPWSCQRPRRGSSAGLWPADLFTARRSNYAGLAKMLPEPANSSSLISAFPRCRSMTRRAASLSNTMARSICA